MSYTKTHAKKIISILSSLSNLSCNIVNSDLSIFEQRQHRFCDDADIIYKVFKSYLIFTSGNFNLKVAIDDSNREELEIFMQFAQEKNLLSNDCALLITQYSRITKRISKHLRKNFLKNLEQYEHLMTKQEFCSMFDFMRSSYLEYMVDAGGTTVGDFSVYSYLHSIEFNLSYNRDRILFKPTKKQLFSFVRMLAAPLKQQQHKEQLKTIIINNFCNKTNKVSNA